MTVLVNTLFFSLQPFHAANLFLYLLKKSENQRFSEIFRGYRKRLATWKVSVSLVKTEWFREVTWDSLQIHDLFPFQNLLTKDKREVQICMLWGTCRWACRSSGELLTIILIMSWIILNNLQNLSLRSFTMAILWASS